MVTAAVFAWRELGVGAGGGDMARRARVAGWGGAGRSWAQMARVLAIGDRLKDWSSSQSEDCSEDSLATPIPSVLLRVGRSSKQ
jgi:hypothetical protein